MQMKKKGDIWISAVLYVMIAVAVTVIVLEAGLPALRGLREKNAFAGIKDSAVALDKNILDIASEGQGSQRVIPVDVTDGEIRFEDDQLRWKLETQSKIVEPRTRQEQGNLIIASDVDVSCSETSSYDIMQNRYILANFTRYGSETNWTSIDSSALLNYVEFKDTNVRTEGVFSFTLNGTSQPATGYTELETLGTGLTSGIFTTHMNTTSFEYDIVFTLESKADFLKVSVENLITK
ncbi:MAG: hypothetical protein V1702_06725 [Candidatus Woesearchaeota archaeon]